MTLTAKSSTTPRYTSASAGAARGSGYLEPAFQAGLPSARKMAVVPYEFAVDGTPTFSATAGMGMGVYLPPNALVLVCWSLVTTAVVGPTNVYMSLEVDFDLIADDTIENNELDTAGDVIVNNVKDVIKQTAVATTAIVAANRTLTTVSREVVFGCSVATISAGKFATYIEYVLIA